MREILFRGKRIDNGEWAYGFYTLTPTGHNVEPAIITGTERLCSIPQFIDPTTIGQYTGLKDKNGTKIFDGDVLAVKFYPRYMERISWAGSPDAIAEVIYDYCGFRLICKGEQDRRYADFYDFLNKVQYENGLQDVCLKHTKVIGNIHDKEGI